jgi:6-phosphogluconolactonase
MRAPEIDVSADAPTLATYVAERLLAQLTLAQAEDRRPHIGLTGGTIANLIYAEVARLGPSSGVDWATVVFWWGDERFVPEGSPDRNSGQAQAALLDPLQIPAAHVHPMPSTGTADSPDEGAEIYGDLLRQHGVGEFEILLLGVGPDGHVASLFPGFPQLDRDDAIALGVYDSPKPPPERITLSLPCLNRSREVWFLASGPEKAWAVSTALAEASQPHGEASQPHGEASLPASRVQGRLATRWFLDRAANDALR